MDPTATNGFALCAGTGKRKFKKTRGSHNKSRALRCWAAMFTGAYKEKNRERERTHKDARTRSVAFSPSEKNVAGPGR